MTHLATEYLRVRQTDVPGAEPITVTRGMYDFNPDAYEVLDGEAATDSGGNPIAAATVLALQPEPASPYEGWKVADLKAEIDKRNEGRDPEGETFLSSAGKRGDLAAVLEADDANTPASGDDDAPGNTGL